MNSRLLCLLTLCLLFTVPAAQAATTFADFENEAEAKAWHDERATTNRNFPVSIERQYAVSGDGSLCLRTPKWQQGMPEWPAVELNPSVRDWSGYDRLYFAITNPTGADQSLSLFISDRKTPTRGGVSQRFVVPASSYVAAVVPVAAFAAAGIDPKDVAVMHFYTQRPEADMVIYLDALTLLKAGEEPPTPSAAYLRQFAELQSGHLTALRESLQQARRTVTETLVKVPAAAPWANAQLAECERQVETFSGLVQRGDPGILRVEELARRLKNDCQNLQARVALRADFEPVRLQARSSAAVPADVVVGFASSMEKVLPRGVAPRLRLSPSLSLSLARNEKEAAQVVVLPCERDLPQVQVRVRDLRTVGGAVFPLQGIQAAPMGYVETKNVPPYGSAHVGWWPDPILDFMKSAEVKTGDAQSFWVRFRAPKTQPAGLYRGTLEVVSASKPLYTFDLRVEVYPFAVPDRSPLNLAVTFSPGHHPTEATKAIQDEWAKSADYPTKAWQRHRLQWGDFLADYYLTYDSLYHHGSPDFEILQRLHSQGRLGMFNLGYYGTLGEKPADREAWDKSTLTRIKTAYEQAKKLGLLDHAYIYGCDENPEAMFPGVQRAAEVFKQECPGALVMTTTYDHSYGTRSVIKAMDAFCPLTPKFEPDLAAQVRAQGKQVWWYICCGPHHPYANMFVEYPAIEGRVLMGAQTVRQRPDGFLYYQISIWNSQKPITGGPFTSWEPRSWTTYHGDGSWTCVGPDGTPCATIRLENFRDGLEDYAYARVLEECVAKVEGQAPRTEGQTRWLNRANDLLAVPNTVMRSMTDYTEDPADILRWRRQMAEAIMSSGVQPELPMTW